MDLPFLSALLCQVVSDTLAMKSYFNFSMELFRNGGIHLVAEDALTRACRHLKTMVTLAAIDLNDITNFVSNETFGFLCIFSLENDLYSQSIPTTPLSCNNCELSVLQSQCLHCLDPYIKMPHSNANEWIMDVVGEKDEAPFPVISSNSFRM